jgi:hypothetical protein
VAAQWPITLQQLANQSGFNYEIGNTVIRSENDIGAPKVRRRFTKSVDKMSVTINCTRTQWNTLYNFFDVTLAGGTLPFEFTNPMTNTVEEFRFIQPPIARPISGADFTVEMIWEKLP